MNITHQKHPKKLKKGDTIAIVSTARKVSSKELAPAILFAKKMGLEVHLGKTIEAKKNTNMLVMTPYAHKISKTL